MIHNHGNTIRETGVNNLITVKTDQQSIIVNQPDNRVVEVRTGPMGLTGRVDTGSLLVTASVDDNRITFTKGDDSTFTITVDTGSKGTISYIDTTNNDQKSDLRNIKIYDYDTINTVAFNGTDETLTLVLGSPSAPTANITMTGFNTDRFNKQTDEYIVTGQHTSTVYNIQRIVLQDNSIATPLVDATGEDVVNPVTLTLTTTGSRAYTYTVFSRNPVTNQLVSDTKSVTRTLNKIDPEPPIITVTPDLQYFGLNGYKIEYGDFGTLDFTAAYGASNGWVPVTITVNLGETGNYSPAVVTPTGTSYTIQSTAIYRSPDGANDPDRQIAVYSTKVYTRMRSLRAGYSEHPISYWTDNDGANLIDISKWQGTIYNADNWVDPSGKQVSITFNGTKYMYIAMDETYRLTGIRTVPFGSDSLAAWTPYMVAGYRIYVYQQPYTLGAFGTDTLTYELT